MRAADRSDVVASVSLLERAVALLPSTDPQRFDLVAALGSALEDVGRLEEAEVLLTDAAREAADAGNRPAEMRLRVEHGLIHFAHGESLDGLDALVDEAVALFERVGDEGGLAAAWTLASYPGWSGLRWNEHAKAIERALEHAIRAGDSSYAERCTNWLLVAQVFGPTPVAEARVFAEKLAGDVEPSSLIHAEALIFLGCLDVMLGEFDQGRALYSEGISRFIDVGARLRRAGGSILGGDIELFAGDPGAAEAELRAGYAALAEMGEKGILSTVAANLAEALYRQGRFEEAEEFTLRSEQYADAADIASQAGWREVRAKVLARGGEFELADRMSADAIRLLAPTDGLAQQAQTFASRAEVLRLAGRPREARQALTEATRLYEAKGVVPEVERTRALLSELGV